MYFFSGLRFQDLKGLGAYVHRGFGVLALCSSGVGGFGRGVGAGSRVRVPI